MIFDNLSLLEGMNLSNITKHYRELFLKNKQMLIKYLCFRGGGELSRRAGVPCLGEILENHDPTIRKMAENNHPIFRHIALNRKFRREVFREYMKLGCNPVSLTLHDIVAMLSTQCGVDILAMNVTWNPNQDEDRRHLELISDETKIYILQVVPWKLEFEPDDITLDEDFSYPDIMRIAQYAAAIKMDWCTVNGAMFGTLRNAPLIELYVEGMAVAGDDAQATSVGQTLSELTSLCKLNISSIERRVLQHTTFANMNWLKVLRISTEENDLPDFAGLTALEDLCVDESNRLKRVDATALHKLRKLIVKKCRYVETCNVAGLDALEELSLQDSFNLLTVNGLDQRSKLRVIDLSNCTRLTGRIVLEEMQNLEKLNLRNCHELCGLGIGKKVRLKAMTLIDLSGTSRLYLKPKFFCKMPALQKLTMNTDFLHQNVWIKEIRFGDMPKLLYISLKSCTSLQKVVFGANMTKLAEISLQSCTSLQKVVFGCEMPALQSLDLSRCTSLDSLDLTKLAALEKYVVPKTTSVQVNPEHTPRRTDTWAQYAGIID